MIKIAFSSVVHQSRCTLHLSSLNLAGKIWRQKHGLPKLQTGLKMFDVPDYSYLDGRPVPLTSGQLKRRKLQEDLCNEIIESLKYIKYGDDKLMKQKEELFKMREASSEAQLIVKAIDVDRQSEPLEKKTRRSSKKDKK